MENLDNRKIIKLVDYRVAQKYENFSYLVINEIKKTQNLSTTGNKRMKNVRL